MNTTMVYIYMFVEKSMVHNRNVPKEWAIVELKEHYAQVTSNPVKHNQQAVLCYEMGGDLRVG